MLTDLRLHKYLQGRLSRREEEELETLLEKNPALKNRLEELRNDERRVTRPAWERIFLDRGERRGSRVRYTTLLPAFLVLVLILGLTAHWFNKPGRNSTFLHAGGNGTAVELLYQAPGGWRYIDAGFRHGDSLTLSVRDGGRYAARVFAIRPGLASMRLGTSPEPVAEEIWAGPEGRLYGKGDPKPEFSSASSGAPPPLFLAVVYDTILPAPMAPEEWIGFFRAGGSEGRAPRFRYQIYRLPEPDPSSRTTTR